MTYERERGRETERDRETERFGGRLLHVDLRQCVYCTAVQYKKRSFGDWRGREEVKDTRKETTKLYDLHSNSSRRYYCLTVRSFGGWRGREEVKDTSAGLPPFGPFLQAPARSGACAGVRAPAPARACVPSCV